MLKSPSFREWREACRGLPTDGELPYGLDALTDDGLSLGYSDLVPTLRRTPRAARALRRLESLGPPFLQTVLAAPWLVTSDAVLALFESEGHFLALLRRLHLWPRRPPLVLVACWLAHLLDRSPSAARRTAYRTVYRAVDDLVFFSRNQEEIFRRHLGLSPERLHFVEFGVDPVCFSPAPGPVEDYVLAAGRDRGRDWGTLFAATRRSGLRVKVLARPSDLAGVELPPGVEFLGYVDRARYRELLARAAVVVVPTHVRAYPTGQTVLLEAMSMGKCAVVTDTPSMRDYLDPGRTALTVPPADPPALREALERATGDPRLRAEVGARARRAVEERFNARRMWTRIAEVLRGAAARRGGR